MKRWRLAGWLGAVLAAEWEAAQVPCYRRDLRVCRFGSEDASAPLPNTGLEDAFVPRFICVNLRNLRMKGYPQMDADLRR